MKTFTVVAMSVIISSAISIGGSYFITVNIIKQEVEHNINIVKQGIDQKIEQHINIVKKEIEQNAEQKVISGGLVLQGGSKIGVMKENLIK